MSINDQTMFFLVYPFREATQKFVSSLTTKAFISPLGTSASVFRRLELFSHPERPLKSLELCSHVLHLPPQAAFLLRGWPRAVSSLKQRQMASGWVGWEGRFRSTSVIRSLRWPPKGWGLGMEEGGGEADWRTPPRKDTGHWKGILALGLHWGWQAGKTWWRAAESKGGAKKEATV